MFSHNSLFKTVVSLALIFGAVTSGEAIAQIIRPELGAGSTGTTVRELQATLKLLNYYNGEVTGNYDEATVIAVYRFQKAAQLPETGIMNQATWDTLFPTTAAITESVTATATTTTVTTTPETTTPRKTATPQTAANTATVQSSQPSANNLPLLREGMDGEAVTLLQRRLATKGFFSGTVDGVFGPQTLQAVIAAQTAFGLDGDGIVGSQTWQKLLD